MTTLADLVVGNQILFACQVTAVDATNGISLNLYGPSATLAASATISPAGAMTGSLAVAPNQAPVTMVTGFAPIAVGDILQDSVGNTYVCMWSEIQEDGSILWSYSPEASVKLPATGYSVVGTATL